MSVFSYSHVKRPKFPDLLFIKISLIWITKTNKSWSTVQSHCLIQTAIGYPVFPSLQIETHPSTASSYVRIKYIYTVFRKWHAMELEESIPSHSKGVSIHKSTCFRENNLAHSIFRIAFPWFPPAFTYSGKKYSEMYTGMLHASHPGGLHMEGKLPYIIALIDTRN